MKRPHFIPFGPRVDIVPVSDFSSMSLSDERWADVWRIVGPSAAKNMTHALTALEIAQWADGERPPVPQLELEILRHMEHHKMAEREACAKIAEKWGQREPELTDTAFIPGADHGERYASAGIADAIRNRT